LRRAARNVIAGTVERGGQRIDRLVLLIHRVADLGADRRTNDKSDRASGNGADDRPGSNADPLFFG
jgi:hypothetical protein